MVSSFRGSIGSVIGNATMISIGLLILMFQYLMGNLSVESIEMKHMDPTDIVLVPFNIHRLTVYVIITWMTSFAYVAFVLLRSSSTSTSTSSAYVIKTNSFFQLLLMMLVQQWLPTIISFWFMAIVCGTPPLRDVYHTGLACTYMATLVVITTTGTDPLALLEKPNPSSSPSSSSTWWQSRFVLPKLPASTPSSSTLIIVKNKHQDIFNAQFMATCQSHGTIFMTIPFQVLRLYDWGSQIQRWPLPIVLGSTYGFVLGSIFGTICICFLNYSTRMSNWYQHFITQPQQQKRES